MFLRRARLDSVRVYRLAAWCLSLAMLWGAVALGSEAGAFELVGDVVQAQGSDDESNPAPSDSDDEVRLVTALLIAVAAVALLGTFIYWVRTGDTPAPGNDDARDSTESGGTLG